MSAAATVATAAAALASGLVAGVFFAFSAFVMPALRRVPPRAGIAAMQSINRRAVRPPLMVALLGTAVLCLVLVAAAVAEPDAWPRGPLIGGAGLYLAGVVGVTIAFNVPRNDRLGRLAPEGPDAAVRWLEYVSGWTAWNHVRTAASASGAAILTAALAV